MLPVEVDSVLAPPVAPVSEATVAEKRRRLFELLLVLLVAFGGALGNAVYLYTHGPGAMQNTGNARWTMGIVQEATSLLLLSYVLSRRGLRFSDLGFRWSLKGAGTGVLLAVAAYLSYAIGFGIMRFLSNRLFGFSVSGHSARDYFPHPSFMAIPFALLNPFFEELIVRAYLMKEVFDLTGSSALAVFLSVAIQTSYHLYYGWARALSLSLGFLIFALYYLRKRQAFPIVSAHAVNDVYGIIRLMKLGA